MRGLNTKSLTKEDVLTFINTQKDKWIPGGSYWLTNEKAYKDAPSGFAVNIEPILLEDKDIKDNIVHKVKVYALYYDEDYKELEIDYNDKLFAFYSCSIATGRG
jgi:hypothetical protein